MKQFIIENIWAIIPLLLIVIVAVVLLFVAKGKYRGIARQILLSLVVTAENAFGGGTGEIKFSYVAERLYAVMPPLVRLLFSEKDIANMIEDAVDKMKEYLANHPPDDKKACVSYLGITNELTSEDM